ncbi:4'-phosphopantetheinyl transferase superfamily protein [Lapidilactobacillus mulanensis]|uniref:4'-phosphopantetheinyl transferase superfamily protein n=1 Tax=Lapidilactobacillus mulanensis TaxID=2485999 RepID=A0ABW4DPC4_9LACO|nr:4'-phosphopantetheinyl transferase superfamily protein [Lapidilactobacillus mulanensis]
MIKGLGIDVQSIDRTSKLIDKYGELLINKVYTKLEWEQANAAILLPKSKLFALMFSFKESAVKAIGSGFNGFEFYEVEITGNIFQPKIYFRSNVYNKYEREKIKKIHSNGTTTESIVFTQVILEG